MEDLSVWMLISAAGAIGLLGVFLAASERELKKTRREIENLVARLENAPAPAVPNAPVESKTEGPDTPAPTTPEHELYDRIAFLTNELEASRRSADELRRQRDQLKESEIELLDLRASYQQLEAELSHLRSQLQSVESRAGAALDDAQNFADDRSRLESVVADLQNQLEVYREQVKELETVRRQLTDLESHQSSSSEELKSAEATISALRQELLTAKEQVQELQSARDRNEELERANQDAKDEILQLHEECSRWQERVAGGEDQRRLSAMLRQQLDELQTQHAALMERHQQFQGDLIAMARLTSAQTDAPAQTAALPISPMEPESVRNAQATMDGGINHPSNGNGATHEIYGQDGGAALNTHGNLTLHVVDSSDTKIASRRKRRFGIFPA